MERDKILNLDLSITGKSRNSKDKIEIFKYHNIDILEDLEILVKKYRLNKI